MSPIISCPNVCIYNQTFFCNFDKIVLIILLYQFNDINILTTIQSFISLGLQKTIIVISNVINFVVPIWKLMYDFNNIRPLIKLEKKISP